MTRALAVLQYLFQTYSVLTVICSFGVFEYIHTPQRPINFANQLSNISIVGSALCVFYRIDARIVCIVRITYFIAEGRTNESAVFICTVRDTLNQDKRAGNTIFCPKNLIRKSEVQPFVSKWFFPSVMFLYQTCCAPSVQQKILVKIFRQSLNIRKMCLDGRTKRCPIATSNFTR